MTAVSDVGAGLRVQERLGWVLFGLGIFVYLFTRLWQIDKFPIFFFSDEANFALLAEGLLSAACGTVRAPCFRSISK